jgi:hypothetical protein
MSTAPVSDHTPDSPAAHDGSGRPTPRFTAGVSDGLGDRQLTFDDATATSLEVLRFKRELSDAPAFEAALRARVEQLSSLHHPTLSEVREVDRRGAGDALTLVSKHSAGRRLSEILHAARGPAFALDFLGQVGPALVALQQHGDGIAHGALTVDRVVVGREGRLVVVEHVLGSALSTMKLPAARLRSDVGIAVSDGAAPALDPRLDVVQLGFIALTLLLGRKLEPSDFPSKIGAHLDAFTNEDAASAERLRPWLERALQIAAKPFADAREAYDAFVDLTDGGAKSSAVAAAAAAKASGRSAASRPSLVQRQGETAPQSRPLHDSSTPTSETFPSEIPAGPSTTSNASGSRSGLTIALGAVAIIEAVVIAGLIYTRPASIGGVAGQLPAPAPVATAPSPALPPPAVDVPNPAATPAVAAAALPAAAPVADSGKPKTEAETLPAGARVGGIKIASPIELQVIEDGRALGSSTGTIAVNDGSHTIELVNESLGFRFRQTVQVKPGQFTTVNISVPNGRVSINAAPWADVWIDGTAAGQTPLANVALPIGQHEVVFRHPQFAEQRQNITVKAEGLARVSAVMK